jgi:3-isopropylmalate/(R)-2-methylmalate dehydratase large subunit
MGVRMFDLGQPGQGIVHVMGPELGIVLPGLTVICGDSHTCTNGGSVRWPSAWAPPRARMRSRRKRCVSRKPRQLRVRCDGALRAGVTAKDLALHIIGKLGAAAGVGSAVEFAGSAIEHMDVEGRLTLCNLSVELGARFGMVAPDERTFDYLRGRPFAPQGEAFDAAVAHWRTCQAIQVRLSTARKSSMRRPCGRPSPGARARSMRYRSTATCQTRRTLPTPPGATR